MEDSLGDRMKAYEKASSYRFDPNNCLFIRVDGKAFHTFTKHAEKPFDQNITDAMVYAARKTAKEMQGFKLAYIQSDECTFMLTDFDNENTQGWFDYKLNKIVSVAASMYTAYFNDEYKHPGGKLAIFDARAFIVPKDDAPNVFVWRQKDWLRNSVQMMAQHHFSHKSLQGVGVQQAKEMLALDGVPWEDLTPSQKHGTFLMKGLESTLSPLTNYNDIKLALEEMYNAKTK